MKIKDIFIFCSAVILFAFCILIAKSVQAQVVRYPIEELGSCRDAKECYLYCEIPTNKPACWAYQTYAIERQVLGESTQSITFPIADLGNCANTAECKAFCEKPENKGACMSFAKAHNLGQFKRQQEILLKAQQELGCSTLAACKAFCSQPVNRERCLAFSKSFAPKKAQEETSKLLEHAKVLLGCDSITACRALCEKPENKEKCHAIISSASAEMRSGFKPTPQISGRPLLTCKTQADCLKICQEHPDKCPSFKRAQDQLKESSHEGPFGNTISGTPPFNLTPSPFPHSEGDQYPQEPQQ